MPTTVTLLARCQTNARYTETFALLNEDGSAMNLTGKSLQIDMRNSPSLSVRATWSQAGGRILVPTPSNGQFTVDVPSSVLASIGPAVLHADLRDVAPADPVPLGKGKVIIEQAGP